MKEKIILVFVLVLSLGLPISLRAAVMTLHETAPTPGELDIYNFVQADVDKDNVGTSTTDGALNDATTYVAMDRGAQGQTFLTGSSKAVYLITGVWVRHCGYSEDNADNTWWGFTSGGQIGIRVTNPSASGTDGFVLSNETYTITAADQTYMGSPAQSSPEGTGTWMHFVFDEPVALAGNAEYGFDLVCKAGTPTSFFELCGIKDSASGGNPYPGGTAYRSGLSGTAGGTLVTAPGDRVFVVELSDAPPAAASIPYPPDKATAVPHSVDLSWVPGFYANRHDVYFGENLDDVTAATVDTSEIYKNRQDANSYGLSDLTAGATYYWRIDEVRVDGVTIDKGKVWSFTTEPSKAWGPAPYDDEICVSVDVALGLSWNSGYNSAASQIYFGSASDSLAPQTIITHTEGTERYSFDVAQLVNNQDYYWRVDSIQADSSVIQGDLWHFRTIPVISVSDPHLVGWWKFDEGYGKAIDWSGLNQHGDVYGDADSVYAYDGSGMSFDGVDDYVELPIGSLLTSLDSTTITAWVNFENDVAWQRIFDFGITTGPDTADPNVNVYMFLSRLDTDGNLRFSIATEGGTDAQTLDTTSLEMETGNWYHTAVTIDAATGTVEIYVDGAVVAAGTTEILPSALGNVDGNWLGRSKFWDPPDPFLTGALDDVRIYDYALTPDEIELVIKVDPLRALKPSPEAGAMPDILHVIPLSWTPGDDAARHDVYFGTNKKAVTEADMATADIYRGWQDSNSYTPPEGIDYAQAYYWRIDEVSADSTVSKGHVWAFTTTDYIVVDDFESYNDINVDEEGSKRIYLTWTDGYDNPTVNGSTIGYPDPAFADGEHFVEVEIVHSGGQSTPLIYNNSVAGYSEVTVNTSDLPIGRNLAQYDVQYLTLWFYGDPNNTATEQLYVKLNDSKITYDGDASDITLPEWTQWNIELADFGVSLTNVTQFGIGLDKTGAVGSSGMIFIDDIRLYWAKP